MTEQILLGYTGVLAVLDLRYRKIPAALLYAGLLTASLTAALRMAGGQIVWQEMVCGVIPGCLLLLYSLLDKERLGRADGFAVLIMGFVLLGESCFWIVAGAFLLAGAWAAVWLLRRKMRKDGTLPFLPFLFAALAFYMLLPGK